MNTEKIKAELDKIASSNGQRLSATVVVDYAKSNKRSELYKAFQSKGLWDDKTAADVARAAFGQHLIRSYKVTIRKAPVSQKVRGYVSLTTDRGVAPSYQLRSEVLSEERKHATFEMDVVKDLRSLARRFVDVLTDSEQRDLLAIATSVEQRAEERVRVIGDNEQN